MFEKILVALDGSEHSLHALETAIQIAKKFNSELTLIHVYSVSVQPILMPEPTGLTPPAVPVMTAGEISKITETSRANGNRILSEGEDKAKAAKVKVKSLLKEGHTVQEILRAVQEGDYSLIAMGRRGISKIKELLLGSVTDGVVRHVYCPVLVVR